MKTRFIHINDISEINTSKITVYDFKNRYIDPHGNMYGLRYDKKTKKIDVIKLIRTPIKAAAYFHQMLKTHKRDSSLKQEYEELFESIEYDEEEINVEGGGIDNDATEVVDLAFNPDRTIINTIEYLHNHKERIHGILMNIRNSNVITESDRINYNQLEDLYRNIDIDGLQRIDRILENHKELTNYPRSISYYLSKLDNKRKKIYYMLDSDTRRMKLIYYSEMYHSIRGLYRNLYNIFKDLKYFLESQNIEEIRDITYNEKQKFYDARLSVDNTISEITKILGENKKLEEFISEPDNF